MNEDSNDRAKAIATAVIWLSLAMISLFAVANSYSMGDLAVILLGTLPVLLALLGTIIIWVVAPMVTQPRTGSIEKAKRGSGGDRLAILLEMLDDDEREAFKKMLKQQAMREMGSSSRISEDGELPFDADLWDEHAANRR